MEELKLPELGENIETVEVSAVFVSAGDPVRRDQPVIEVETEKASLEIPAHVDGRIAEVLVRPGDKIQVGQVVLRVDTEPVAKPEPPALSVGRAGNTDGPAAPAGTPAAAAAAAPVLDVPVTESRGAPEIGPSVPAAPSARALARQLGVDIADVPGSGPGGRISREDVKAYTKSLVQGRAAAAPRTAAPQPALPDFERWGEVERQSLGNVRRATAASMANAWSTVPHVTQFDHADITELESMRKRFNRRPDAEDRKLTLTAILIKLVAAALQQFPKFNSSLDLGNDSLIHKKYVRIGVAVDTDRGLLVPVIRDADRKSLVQVARELSDLAGRARDRKLSLEEMRGANFTVSNLGGLGTTYFSPIVNWPEVAILGVGRAEHQAVLVSGERFEPRLIMPLSLSYDHRVIDGADAARFLRWLAEGLEQPLVLLADE